MYSNTFPHSPDLEHSQPLLKERSSPLSLLAHDIGNGLFLDRGSSKSYLPNNSLGNEKTPRRSLLSQLTATAMNFGLADVSNQGNSGICDLTANMQSKSVTINNIHKSALFSSPLALGDFHNFASSSEDSASFVAEEEDADMIVESDIMKTDDFTSVSGFHHAPLQNNQNSFSQRIMDRPPSGPQFVAPAVKSTLKFQDQNGSKPPRANLKFNARQNFMQQNNIAQHWHHRKSGNSTSSLPRCNTVGMVVGPKKRECEDSPKQVTALSTNGIRQFNTKLSQKAANPHKFRRAMTFNGAANTNEDFFTAPELILPSFPSDKDMLRRITHLTLRELLNGAFSEKVDEFHLIDCRYPYEYQGGHIKSASNICEVAELQAKFFASPATDGKRVVIVFHCEYSVQRAPQMALHFRGVDRNVNKERYPYLNYPDIYILEGGYSDFFKQQKIFCEPQAYVKMDDCRYKTERNAGIIANKKDFPKISAGFFH